MGGVVCMGVEERAQENVGVWWGGVDYVRVNVFVEDHGCGMVIVMV